MSHKFFLAGFLSIIFVLTSSPSLARGEEPSLETIRERIASQLKRPGWERDAIPGQAIVKFRADAKEADRSRALAAAGPATREFGKSSLAGCRFVAVDPSVSLEEALRRLQNDPAVAWAGPVWTKRLAAVPNDPRFSAQWSLRNTGQPGYGNPYDDTQPGTPGSDIEAAAAWDLATEGQGVVVAIIDTGTDLNHPDLRDNLWTNPGEVPGDGIDNDGNGYIDDVHGCDFAAGPSDQPPVFDGDPTDIDGHGTGVAGVALATGNNNVGIAGVAWRGRIMTLKVLSTDGYISDASLLLAYDYAAAMGASIVNASYEGYQDQPAEENALQALGNQGIVVIAAAGNDYLDQNRPENRVYPAAYDLPNIVTVGATQRNDILSWFSNFGGDVVDLMAPGQGILTTFPNYDPDPASDQTTADFASPRYDDDDNGFFEYGVIAGTSFSTPFVTGAAALLRSAHPELTPAQVRDRLIAAADPLPSLSQAAAAGGGRLNLLHLLDFQNPYVSYLVPPVLVPGDTTEVLVRGVNLDTAATVEFSGGGVSGTVDSGGSVNTGLRTLLSIAPLETQMAREADVTVRNPGGASDTLPAAARVQGYGKTYTNSTPINIPDGTGVPIYSTLQVTDDVTIADLDLHLDILHSWIGDLVILLEGPDGTQWTVLNLPGYFLGWGADGSNDILTWFPSQSFPEQPIHPFTGKSAQGTWTLIVADFAELDEGILRNWSLRIVGEDAWTFDSPTIVFTAPVPSQGPGSLSLRSGGTANTFGYWYSEPNVIFPLDTLLRLDFTVATDVADPAKVPLYRFRLNSDDAQLVLLHNLQRNGNGPYTPTPGGVQTTWLTAPPPLTAFTNDLEIRYEQAFDLMNFDSRIEPSGQLTYQSLSLQRIPISSLSGATLERNYTFSGGTEGWFQGTAPIFTSPVFSSNGGKLTIQATNSTSTFGIWTSPADVTIDPNRLYRLRFQVASNTPRGNAPTLRVRAGDSLQQHGVALVVNSKGDSAYAPPAGGKDYDLYYLPPAGLPAGLGLEAAFDLMNFDPGDSPTGDLSLLSLRIDSFPRP